MTVVQPSESGDQVAIIERRESLEQVTTRIKDAVVATASGTRTLYERHTWLGHQVWELLIHGPTV